MYQIDKNLHTQTYMTLIGRRTVYLFTLFPTISHTLISGPSPPIEHSLISSAMKYPSTFIMLCTLASECSNTPIYKVQHYLQYWINFGKSPMSHTSVECGYHTHR